MVKIIIPWAKPAIGKEELNEVIDSFQANWLTMGPKVAKFEDEMATFLNVPHAIAVSNGSVALDIALKTIGIESGDEVIVPAMTYFATAAAVSFQNAIPVFVDIEKDSYNLDPEKIVEAITEKTKAIIFIDYGGNPSYFDEIAMVGKNYGIPVIQDAAQSLGAIYKESNMGAQTVISTMSFHMAKIMSTVEGGMIFTNNDDYNEEIRSRRNQGESKNGKYLHKYIGTNARMTDMHAGIGLAQFKKLPDLLRGRKRVAQKYDKLFLPREIDIKISETIIENSYNSYFFYPILITDRDRIAEVLKSNYGIDTRIAYPMPVYEQEVYASGKSKCKNMECPIAEKITSTVLNLPLFPDMTDEEIKYVVDSIDSELKS